MEVSFDDDKQSVTSETAAMPQETTDLADEMQTSLIENKPALSEGGYSDHGDRDEHDEIVAAAANCTPD